MAAARVRKVEERREREIPAGWSSCNAVGSNRYEITCRSNTVINCQYSAVVPGDLCQDDHPAQPRLGRLLWQPELE